MRTVLRIFTRDLRRILHNPAAIVIALGVCIIPSLYAWINILANWNPYENTATVPVAVVIEDEGTTIPDMGHVNLAVAPMFSAAHQFHRIYMSPDGFTCCIGQ